MSKTSSLKSTFPLYKYPIQIFVFLMLIVFLTFVSQSVQNQLYLYFVPSIIAFAFLTLVTPWVAQYLRKTFLSLYSTICQLTESGNQEWFDQYDHFIFGANRWSILVAILVAIGGEITNYYLAWGLWSGFAKAIFFLQIGVLFGILGFLGWAYLGILIFAYHLRDLKFDLEPFETKKEEFAKLNSSFLGIFGSGIILYIGALIAAWLVTGPYILDIPLLQLWIPPFAIAVISFFLLIQVFLHEVMKKAKNIRINKMNTLMRQYFREWEKTKSSDQSTQINNLLGWKEKIEKESDWPFDVLTVISVVVTIFLPAVRAILELL